MGLGLMEEMRLLRRTSGILASLLLMAIASTQVAAQVSVVRVASGLNDPLYVTAPPGDFDRLFVVEQGGAIKILDLATLTIKPTVFLQVDLPANTAGEQGLLGLAFHPDYTNNGLFYVNLAAPGIGTEIRRYQVTSNDADRADPASQSLVIQYDQPFSNHNGGWLGFGTDGFLYITSGDGGSANDPGNRAQDITDQKLGKILRLDINGDDFPGDPNRNYAIPASNPFVGQLGDDEIWAFGLRNPFRASFDRLTGDFYIGDVGQGSREEVNFQPAASSGGENYGWKVFEGSECFDPAAGGPLGCADPTLVPPIHDYGHVPAPDGGFAITGGYVYRGPIASLNGLYFFADFVSRQIWSFRYDGTTRSEFLNRTASLAPNVGTIDFISSFGEDTRGNLYIVDLGGEVFVLTPTANSLAAAVLPGARAVTLGSMATAFLAITNNGAVPATNCRVSPAVALPASFTFRAIDPQTNQLQGAVNDPFSVAPGATGNFVIAFDATQGIAATEVALDITCDSGVSAPSLPSVNRFTLTASTSATADILAVAATASNDGIATIPGSNGTGFFAAAGINIGASETLTLRPVAPGLALGFSICETNVATSQCLAAPTPTIDIAFQAGQTRTFAVFITGDGSTISGGLDVNRIRLQFEDESGSLRGLTHVAVQTGAAP